MSDCMVKLNTVTTVGSPAAVEDLANRAASLIDRAFAAQGPKALEFTRQAAAHHEAGHAVINTLDGIATKYCKVKRSRNPVTGRTGWIGFTDADDPWSVTLDTAPEDDLRNIRRVLAGWAAEILFEGEDFAFGSSIDELLIAGNLAAIAGDKLGRDPYAVLHVMQLGVLADLSLHGQHVRAVACALMRERVIRGERLLRLLPPAAADPPGRRQYPRPLIAELRELLRRYAGRMNGRDGVAA